MVSASTVLCMYGTLAYMAVATGHHEPAVLLHLSRLMDAEVCALSVCPSCCALQHVQAMDAIQGSSEQADVALRLASAVIRLGAARQDAAGLGAASAVGDVVAATAELLLRMQLPAAEAALAAWLTSPPLELRLTWPRQVPTHPHGCTALRRSLSCDPPAAHRSRRSEHAAAYDVLSVPAVAWRTVRCRCWSRACAAPHQQPVSSLLPAWSGCRLVGRNFAASSPLAQRATPCQVPCCVTRLWGRPSCTLHCT